MSEVGRYIGVDIGATNVKIVAISTEGAVLHRQQFPTDDSALPAWAARVKARAAELSGQFGQPSAIGVAAPGIVGPDHRRVSWMQGRMEALSGFDWTLHLESQRFVPVINDAKAALLAEAWLGAASGAKNVILLTLGTGIGGAAIVDGRLLDGAIGRAGHLGHISLNASGAPDICRTPGSLEECVGNVSISRRTAGRFADVASLVAAASARDAAAHEVWRITIRDLAAGIISLVNVLDPEIVVLGGGMIGAGPELFGPLANALDDMEWRPFGPGVPVVPAKMGEYAGAIGAARFAMIHPDEGHEPE